MGPVRPGPRVGSDPTVSHPLIDWNLAERVAVRVGGREPFSTSYHYGGLDPDFERFTAQAEELVGIETGLRSLSGPARGRVTTRAGWIRANRSCRVVSLSEEYSSCSSTVRRSSRLL